MEKAEKVMVAIDCIVYNHEPYIRQCLEGFVMQKTTFPFVAIVHDDASTDKSADIIREYAERYPDIIYPVYEIENQYSKRDKSLTKIRKREIDRFNPKYIAFCEGDDYWIDPLKLQKQVDILEKNEEYGMCYTNFDIFYHETGVFKHALLTNSDDIRYKTDITIYDWLKNPGYLGPMSWVVRKDLWLKNYIQCLDGTFVTVADFLVNSKMYCLKDEVTSVYRSHKGSVTQSNSFRIQFLRARSMFKTTKKLSELYLTDSVKRKNVEDISFKRFYSIGNFYKILCYGSKEEIHNLKRIENLSFIQILFLRLSKFDIWHNIFVYLYKYYVHYRTGLDV